MDSDYLFGNCFRRTPAPTGLTPNCIRVLVERDSASAPDSHVQNTPVNLLACERSTGATGECSPPAPLVISSNASGRTASNSRRNSRRETVGASSGRLRQTRIMLDAKELEPIPIERDSRSVHWPSACQLKSRTQDCFKEGLPAG